VHLLSNGQVMLQGRTSILKDLLAESHETTNIEPPFSVLYGCNTRIGKNFYGNVKCVFNAF
jgi:maltose O-acetyltransferase